MKMARYLARRLALLVPVLLGISLIVFLSVRLLPGDVAQVMLGAESTPQALRQLREELGLDRPWPAEYLRWLAGMARGDWGRSLRTQFRVAELIARKLPATVELAAAALLLAAAVGIPLGILGGIHRGSWWDRILSTAFTAGISMPGFGVGTLLILALAVHRTWLPSSGYVPFSQEPLRNLLYLLLPAAALSVNAVCAVGRMARAAMIDTEQSPYARFAEAKGLPPGRIFWRHRLLNALGPVVSLLGLESGYLLAGAVLIETLFGWPGMGKLLADSIFERDYPVVQTVVVLNCAVFLVMNLGAELATAWIDPRNRPQ